MLKLEIKDKKCDMDIRGDRFECIAEMTIAFDALIESAAAANGMTYEEAKKMLCHVVDKAHEGKKKDGE